MPWYKGLFRRSRMTTTLTIFSTMCCIIGLVLLCNYTSFPVNLPYGSHPSSITSQCRPKTNIMFLKVHKAGSSTVFNVLGRFVINNKLNMAIPYKKKHTARYNYLGNSSFLTKDMVLPLPEGQRYNMFLNHVVYNRTFFDMILPRDTFYLAIVRNPEERFSSAAKYFGLVHRLSTFSKTPFVFEQFLKDPNKFGNTDLVHNQMAHDFGIPKTQYNNQSFVEEYIQKLDREFNLVLLLDYFDESLIMLRRKLCWSLKDVLYLKQNSASKPKKKIVLTESDRNRLEEFQFADVMIYNHFQTRFWKDLNSFEIDIHYETNHFKDVRRRMESFCSSYIQSKDKFITIAKSLWNSAFNITIFDCNILNMKELPMLDKITANLIQTLNT
ncbi:hypothetical protein LOTGIDRAFT_158219 [Lottia gigantea]|uniref:Galactosylceramide sulfotransferase-like n=1 Tax=Lottia gigantea TaxID=225164 RepID=V4CDK3_LOTGI|nr:hypothetical protein LOTGIDRAFT_158219 [Lottia gigantea]ESO99994.1 hypothetical protein LOTGIDRAFT_158219 [Lottia gigantea]